MILAFPPPPAPPAVEQVIAWPFRDVGTASVLGVPTKDWTQLLVSTSSVRFDIPPAPLAVPVAPASANADQQGQWHMRPDGTALPPREALLDALRGQIHEDLRAAVSSNGWYLSPGDRVGPAEEPEMLPSRRLGGPLPLKKKA